MSEEKKAYELRSADLIHDRSALAEALSIVVERIAESEQANRAARHLCGFLQESVDVQVLQQAPFDADPVREYVRKSYLSGVSDGIAEAIEHLTNSTQIRALREWNETFDKET